MKNKILKPLDSKDKLRIPHTDPLFAAVFNTALTTFDGMMAVHTEKNKQKAIRKLLENVELLTTVRTLTPQVIYDKVYLKIPEYLVEEMLDGLGSGPGGTSFVAEKTYEEIMKLYMDDAADVDNFFINLPGTIRGFCKTFDMIINQLNKYLNSDFSTLDVNIYPFKPYMLVLLWGLLMTDLVAKYLGSCKKLDKTKIAKLSMSIVIAGLVGSAGYMHSGGFIGIWSPTPLIRTYYNLQKSVEKSFPKFYALVPPILKFPSCESFDTLISEKQISAGKGLTMAYTFRVGDSFLTSLENNSTLDESVMLDVLQALWPLPNQKETERMYKIYSENSIYSL